MSRSLLPPWQTELFKFAACAVWDRIQRWPPDQAGRLVDGHEFVCFNRLMLGARGEHVLAFCRKVIDGADCYTTNEHALKRAVYREAARELWNYALPRDRFNCWRRLITGAMKELPAQTLADIVSSVRGDHRDALPSVPAEHLEKLLLLRAVQALENACQFQPGGQLMPIPDFEGGRLAEVRQQFWALTEPRNLPRLAELPDDAPVTSRKPTQPPATFRHNAGGRHGA